LANLRAEIHQCSSHEELYQIHPKYGIFLLIFHPIFEIIVDMKKAGNASSPKLITSPSGSFHLSGEITMASSVAHAPVPSERLDTLIAELYGDHPASLSITDERWQQAVMHVGEQLRAKLRVEVLPERMRKALELVSANAVTLQTDGTASVQSGKQTYTLAPDCPCADAKHRAELCKHALAVELHRRALAVLPGPAGAPAPAPTQPAAAAATPPAAAPSAPASHAWDVHEAPASACFKFRVGTMELMYTLRGVDDGELQRRITATLPTLQEVIEACEERAAQRAAAREAQAAQAQQAPAAAGPQADLQALLQQALAAANGQAPSTPPPALPSNGTAPSSAAPDDQQTGFCSIHQVPMEQKSNERGTWYSHWLEDEQRYCKGVRPTRRNGQSRR
jgi:hypothetical protein